MVRRLFPLVISACKSGSGSGDDGGGAVYCPEWKEWGRLLTSTLAILCPLNEVVKTAFCDAVVAGIPSPLKEKQRIFFSDALEFDANSLPVDQLDDASSAIMTLLSVLGSGSSQVNDRNDEDEENWKYYLPLLPPVGLGGRTTTVDYLGCELPPSTYIGLTKVNVSPSVVAKAMGAIIQNVNGDDVEDDMDVEDEREIMNRMLPLLAAIIMHVLQKLEKEATKAQSPNKQKRKRKGGQDGDDEKWKADRDVMLLLSLVSHDAATHWVCFSRLLTLSCPRLALDRFESHLLLLPGSQTIVLWLLQWLFGLLLHTMALIRVHLHSYRLGTNRSCVHWRKSIHLHVIKV
jgi:hypothetical protein